MTCGCILSEYSFLPASCGSDLTLVTPRRSIHMFMTMDPTQSQASVAKAKLSQQILYAQQMDRILLQLDTKRPYVVMYAAITEARVRFQTFLAAFNLNSRPQGEVLSSADANPSEEPQKPRESSQKSVLELYEHVVDAKASVNAMVPINKQRSRHATVVVPLARTSDAFQASLKLQREIAEREISERHAAEHFRKVALRRIQRAIRCHWLQKQQKKHVLDVLNFTRARAIRILQQRISLVYKSYRQRCHAMDSLLRRNQARRIATFCFWKWIYWYRCGYATFSFQKDISDGMLHAVVR